MKLPIYQIDAFTDQVFMGNYAAVVPLDRWLPDSLMQAIAAENNVSETAFFVKNADGAFDIRWFSPLTEIAFCGHATLASAYAIFMRCKDLEVIEFVGKSVGRLTVRHKHDGLIEMSFPQRRPERLNKIPGNLLQGLSIQPQEVLISQQAYVAIYGTEQEVRSVVPALDLLSALGPLDVVVTARGDNHDFVSRYFWPANGGDEDPVTGSIHAALAPLWSERLGRSELVAMQVSRRSGLLYCRVQDDAVYISGRAVQYLEGTIEIPEA
ncbi:MULTISPECIES: PhzF family phenazine biosynthesis protein [unclassified Caballeronia]|uniref:PhzF family phenazine biosynthesis protein n=1 Tax=unclassified Caballeronia TaxID=2646786 RepID=UPI00285D7ACB|nr:MULTISPECIES: PhzF family phenazine biosynthesis protein [unclassified Caballeronia]MDR5755195.1 PhzF family phenazine biosynthesis protein [Caballeronia sp. LZ024]MDR5845395.1 PhzF family phenazine biosynthesis protein [Caballeronia sp. LZ031]